MTSDHLITGQTIVEALWTNSTTSPDAPAMRRHTGSGWETITWEQYAQAVREVAAGLAMFGIGPDEKVAILSGNRAEWHLADLGAMANGSVTVPLYQTSSAAQIAYVIGHSEARICFLDTHEQLGKVLEIRDQVPKLDRVVIFENSRRLDDTFVTGFEELRATGAERLVREPHLVEAGSGAIRADRVATLVYTSGTTGPPKGTMITHANIMWTIRNATIPFQINEGERLLSFLPLSHIAERMMSDFLPIAIGGETWFARSLATVAEDLPACRPTVFFAVPRVWEKLRAGIEDAVSHQPAMVRHAMDEYVALGMRRVAAEQEGVHHPRWAELAYDALDRTIGARLRREVGLDEAHVLITAAAPCHPDLIRWFNAVGLPLVELYGQTEVCGPTTVNPPAGNRIGTVGPAIPGVRVRIADDGEILVKGENVCLGYYKDPHATAELFDDGGWMRSGDLGVLEADGYLRVTGRKKDLIINAAGKNIAPQEIETDLRYHDLISQAVVVGEGRRYLTAVITLDPEALSQWAERHGKLVELEALADDPDIRAEVGAIVDEVNGRRSRAEWIRRFRILAHDLTVAGGELTPTLKVKRNVVYEKYQGVIEEMYADTSED